MGFFSRQSRQRTPSPPTNHSSEGDVPEHSSPSDQRDESEEPSSNSQNNRRMSKDSEGYPSWLPKRPPPPAPASTFQSSIRMHEAGPSDQPFVGGRKPTPRSVRIVSLQDAIGYDAKDRREPTDQTRVGTTFSPRVWSRRAGVPTPDMFSAVDAANRVPQPRFRSRGLHLELLRSPSPMYRLYFYFFRLFVFLHIPVQTFFDFNAVFILIQVSRFPNPEAPGVPGSGRNWALGAAAYVACWLAWVFVVFVLYELIYSFTRRWRLKRPLMYPIYMSSPAFNFVAISSYTKFCFLQHLRYAAFFGDGGSVRDGLAETFWFYSQNLPTVALLLPRAALSLALLLAFTHPDPAVVALADAGIRRRDPTFFRPEDGTLTNYSRGVLIANAAWTAWRTLVLLTSCIGLWISSGQGCAGLCGPRYRWEEEDLEKTTSVYSDNQSDTDAIPWTWRECARLRIQDAYDFCMTNRPPRWSRGKKDISDASDLLPISPLSADPTFDNMEKVLAAVGLGGGNQPARRGILSDDLFQGPHGEQIRPRTETPPELAAVIPQVVKRSEKAHRSSGGPSSPLMSLPYPFTAAGAQISSEDRIPFPPSPDPSGEKTSSGSPEDGELEDEEDEEVEGDDEGAQATSGEPSSGRASGSMSSLGQPVSSRYPFQFRRPARGTSPSSGAPSNATPQSNNRSLTSRISGATQSTGNRESTDSQSPKSHYTSGSDPISMTSGIPMPPRHPRARAGTVPIATSSSPSPVAFPRSGRARTRLESGTTEAFGPGMSDIDLEHEDDGGLEDEQVMEQPEPEGSHEEAEGDDVVGLLSRSAGPSPRTSLAALRHHRSSISLRQRASSISLHRHHHQSGSSRSGSNSRTHSHSGSSSSQSRSGGSISIPVSVRSRAQSLMHNIGSASRSSVELVQGVVARSRSNSSMGRLEEDLPYFSDDRTHSHSRSGSTSDAVQSSGENYTFGHPLRTQWQNPEERVEEEGSLEGKEDAEPTQEPASSAPSQSHLSTPMTATTSQRSSAPTATPPSLVEERDFLAPEAAPSEISHPDISTAAPSFITQPVTIEGATTDDGGRTVSSWGGVSHMVDRSDPSWRPV